MISLLSFVKSAPRCASTLPFLSLILCHFECPDILCQTSSGGRSLARADYPGREPHPLMPRVPRDRMRRQNWIEIDETHRRRGDVRADGHSSEPPEILPAAQP